MILLNDILRLQKINQVKIRLNISFGDKRPAIDYFTDQTAASMKRMRDSQYWNYSKKKNFKVDDITLGFVPFPLKKNCWMLFHVGKVTKDLNVFNGVGYEAEDLSDYEKYLGRLIIKYENHGQNLIRKGNSILHLCEVDEILPEVFNNDIFPGYENVNVSWKSLSTLISKKSWQTALANQKGVYLLVDTKTGKKYVGSAYGQEMLLGRWESYIRTINGGNKKLLILNDQYIKDNFNFTILETFNKNTPDQTIIERECFWKNVLLTRTHGYNDN